MKKQLRQLKGKIRRYVLVRFRPDYVEQQAQLRQGECNQCGNCCEILFKCPFLVRGEDGAGVCSIYEDRPGQCAAFPVDEACLAEVDFDCTFEFSDPGDLLVTIEQAGEADNGTPELAPPSGRLTQTRPITTLLFHHFINRLR